jgi:ribose transport system ATP-binding protein
MRGITKTFPRRAGATNVDLMCDPARYRLVKRRGKSTLMKILAGVYERDAGEVVLKGKPVVFTNPRQAQLAGIVTIYQELNQVPEMSVTENIFLGSELERGVC